MATSVQLRRGTTTQNNAFTGALGEASVDTTLDTIRVHDGSTAGGFEITLANKEIGEFVQDWRNSDFDMFVSANGGNPDPDQYFYRTFKTGGSTNVFKYSDGQIDEWLDKGRKSTSTEERRSIYNKVQEKLACEGPISHIAYGDLSTAVNKQVKGFEIYATGRLASLISVTK